jgi:hypothetical protein
MSESVVGYRSIITALNVSSDPLSASGFPPAALANGLTFDRCRFSATGVARIYIDAGAPVTCDYFGIAAHNLWQHAGTARLFGDTSPITPGTDGATAVAGPTALTTASPALVTFGAVAFRYWNFRFDGTVSSGFYELAVLYLGQRLTFERCLMRSHSPGPLNRRTEYYDNDSESGQFLGRSILRKGHKTTVAQPMMTAAWVRAEFQSFVKAARVAPYFFAWNPDAYAGEVIFGRTKEDIGVEYTGDRDRMTSSWDIEGLGYDE